MEYWLLKGIAFHVEQITLEPLLLIKRFGRAIVQPGPLVYLHWLR